MSRFVCRFAVGANGHAYSGLWRVWSAKNRPDLYCAALPLGGEIKASIHAPRLPDHPAWERHWGFDFNAQSEVAKSAKRDGGPHKLMWPGFPLAAGCSLEWRIVFFSSSLRTNLFAVGNDVTLLPIPGEGEQVEVAVILGPPGFIGSSYPREEKAATHLLADGALTDGHKVWIVYFTRPSDEADRREDRVIEGKGQVAPDANSYSGEMRGIGAGRQADGSLAFFDLRAEKKDAGFVLRP
jgi:hypothetical protein